MATDTERTALVDEAQAKIAHAFEGWGQAWWTDNSGDVLARVAADAIAGMLVSEHDVEAMADVARQARLAERNRVVEWLHETYTPARMADRIALGEHMTEGGD